MVCRLKRSIYGLVQAGLCWHEDLRGSLLREGYTQCVAEPCLFFADTPQGRTWIIIYVDDALIIAPLLSLAQSRAHRLAEIYEATILGEPDDFLGISFARDRSAGTITLHQQAFIRRLLHEYDVLGEPAPTLPVNARQPPLLPESGAPLDPDRARAYPSIVGSLNYLATCTRPDIANGVSILSRFLRAPRTVHWDAAIYLLRYLGGTRDLGLCYRRAGPARSVFL